MNHYPWLDEYLKSKPGTVKDFKPEWGWFRYMLCGKQFAAVCTPDPEHALHKGRTMVILKCDPQLAELYRAQFADVVPGFYCNKQHWNSVYLDGAVPEDTLRSMCDMAYDLILHKLPKKVQQQIADGAPAGEDA
ncbi:MAG: MmcQ/YjbR family DNA-binding protein [Clostridia bacterium]|nr:MmcQ/YjbR family DNA-binding protein [Clostridia bacterium]